MRIALIDLLFSWPPHGGAVVDAVQTASGLQRLGHEVRLFAAGDSISPERAPFNPKVLPVPAERILGSGFKGLARAVAERVNAWKPDVAILGDGYFLKPEVAAGLGDFPVVARYYAYELTCLRDHLQFKNGAHCENDYLRTPEVCRRCALESLGGSIRRWSLPTWGREFVEGGGYGPSYYESTMRSLERYRSIIVYNPLQARLLEGFHGNVHVVPGGVAIDEFSCSAPRTNEKRSILMAGRAEDPVKGLDTLIAAGAILSKTRTDFVIEATHYDKRLDTEWLRTAGWREHGAMNELYAAADICVAPSLWEEPFGLVAVEAMAAGRPVVASRVGGLQEIVVDGDTGYLFSAGNAAELASRLDALLDDAGLRARMGASGRARAEREYAWDVVVPRYYTPVLEAALR